MAKSHASALAAHVPLEAVKPLMKLLHSHQIRLVITRDRITKLGDFRPAVNGSPARISVNGGLNIYEFLMVFLHELAHLYVHEKCTNKVRPHGTTWKQIYGELIRHYAEEGIFHPSLCDMLVKYSYKVKASGIADLELSKALRRFDRTEKDLSWHFLEELPRDSVFKTSNGRLFRKEDRLKRRFACQCMHNNRKYLFHPTARVWTVNE